MRRNLAPIAILVVACTSTGGNDTAMSTIEHLSRAETAWRAGAFEAARSAAEASMAAEPDDLGERRLLVLSSAALGRHEAAVRAFVLGLPADEALDEAMLWSHVRLGDPASARRYAKSRGLLRNRAIAEQIRLAETRPMRVTAPDLVELPYAEDALTPFMPGTAAVLNGTPTIVRFDTGGSFVHMTRRQARYFGVSYAGCERGFAGLRFGRMCHGVADFRLGDARFQNVPVSVHPDQTFPSAQVAASFGVDMGPIIGTNIFGQFLTTFDTPYQRLILSPRGNAAARRRHKALLVLNGPGTRVPFGLLGSHHLIARGRLGDRDAVFFVDSGLAAMNDTQGQATLLMTSSAAGASDLSEPRAGRFAEMPWPVGLADRLSAGKTAMIVSERTWRDAGTWQGVRVDALISYGYLKDFVWTLDFEERVLVLQEPNG